MKKIFIIVLFILFGLVVYSQSLDRVEAVIGNEIVLTSDIESQYMQYLSQGNIRDEAVRCQIVEDILFQKLLINQAKLDSIEVSEEEIDAEVLNRLNYFESQLGSIEKVEEYFRKSKDAIELELSKVIYNQLLAQQVQRTISADMHITPSEVAEFFNRQNDEDIPVIPAQVEISQIVLKPIVSDIDKDKIRTKLNSFRDRIYKGEDFKMLATLYSDDIGSASLGGELGFVNRGDLVPEFERAAFKLKENEISEVIETDFGFHIIQLIERRGEQINVRHILLKVKVSSTEMYNTKIRIQKILDDINENKISFDDAIEQYSEDDSKNNKGLLLNTTNMSTLHNIDDMDVTLKILVDKMSVGDVSKPVIMKLPDDTDAYRIIMLNKKIDAHKANLTDDFSLIKDFAINLKQQEQQADWISRKVDKTYIKLHDDIKSCVFKNKWID